MRIAVDATAAVRQYAGVGRFARGVLGGLGRLDAHNHYVLIMAGTPRLTIAADQLPQYHSWLRLPLSERVATILWQRLKVLPPPTRFAGRCALFFTPDYALPPVGALPGVVTVHDLSFLIHPECADERLRRYLCAVVPRAVQRAAAVIAVSQTTAMAVADLLGVEERRIHVVPNGVDRLFSAGAQIGATGGASDEQGATARLRERLGLEPGYLLSVGTLEPRKNYVRLLQAFAQLRRRAAKTPAMRPGHGGWAPRLVIAGREGWLYEPIFREVARLGLGNAVRFVTRADDRDLLALYCGARAFAYPSVYEGFGIPPLEAMACGIPVAASTGGAIPEVLGAAAAYFDPADVDDMAAAIERVLLDEALRADLMHRGRERAALYTWEGAAAEALSLFNSIAA